MEGSKSSRHHLVSIIHSTDHRTCWERLRETNILSSSCIYTWFVLLLSRDIIMMLEWYWSVFVTTQRGFIQLDLESQMDRIYKTEIYIGLSFTISEQGLIGKQKMVTSYVLNKGQISEKWIAHRVIDYMYHNFIISHETYEQW